MFEWKNRAFPLCLAFISMDLNKQKTSTDVGGSCKFCICQLRIAAGVHFCFCSNLLDICQLKNHQLRLIFAAIIPNHFLKYLRKF